MKSKNRINSSIRTKFTITFIAFIFAAFAVSWIANILFLQRIYLKNTQKYMRSLYQTIHSACETGVVNEDFFDALQTAASTQNMSIVIADMFMKPIIVSTNEPSDRIYKEFLINISDMSSYDRLLEQTDNYIMVSKKDTYSNKDLFEMWGKLPGNRFFMIRTALAQVKTSAQIANKLSMYIGFGASLISGIIIYFITSKITKPILKIADLAEKMSEMDFETKYSEHRNDEIDVLGKSINKMSHNLESTISELKAANIELQKDIDEKTKLDEMRKDFVSSVSHELKTPIALIEGYAEGLKEGISDEDERDYYCDVIIDEAMKMNAMVKKLLTLNQLEAGGQALSISRFDIVELVNNYVSTLELLLQQNNINLSVEKSQPIWVWADEMNIEEVVMNYLSNAINHCESDIAKRIDVRFKKEENKVKISVFNTGKNIPEENLEHLWEKFYKVDKARSREYGGSGLGLSIVKAIVEAHHENYGVENKPDGVEFWFTLDAS